MVQETATAFGETPSPGLEGKKTALALSSQLLKHPLAYSCLVYIGLGVELNSHKKPP